MVQCKKKGTVPQVFATGSLSSVEMPPHAIGGGFHTLSHPKDYLLDSPFIDLL